MRVAPPFVPVSTKGQIVIPHGVRRRLGINAGDRLVLTVEDNRVVLTPAERHAQRLRGVAKGAYGRTAAQIDAYVRGERRSWQT